MVEHRYLPCPDQAQLMLSPRRFPSHDAGDHQRGLRTYLPVAVRSHRSCEIRLDYPLLCGTRGEESGVIWGTENRGFTRHRRESRSSSYDPITLTRGPFQKAYTHIAPSSILKQGRPVRVYFPVAPEPGLRIEPTCHGYLEPSRSASLSAVQQLW